MFNPTIPDRLAPWMLTCLASLVLVLAPAGADAGTIEPPDAGAPAQGLGVERIVEAERIPLDGRVILSPGRMSLGTFAPGHVETFTVTLRNRRSESTTFAVRILGAAPSPEPDQSILLLDPDRQQPERSARDWLTPAVDTITLAPRERADIDMRIRVPDNALAGGSYAAISIEPTDADDADMPGAPDVQVTPGISALVLIDVDGERIGSIDLESMDARRVTFGRAELPVSVSLTNTGNIHAYVDGDVAVHTMFGTAIAALPIRSSIMLPGADTRAELAWTGTPWLGAYRLELAATPTTGAADSDDDFAALDASRWVIILPPVWILVGVGLAAAGWIGWRLQHRRLHARDVLEDDGEDW